MGLGSSIARFVARELTRPLLEKVGEHVGDAIGTVIGKMIDPNHGREKVEDADEDEKPDTHNPSSIMR